MRVAVLIGCLAVMAAGAAWGQYRPYSVKPYDPYDLPKNSDFRPPRNPYDLPEPRSSSRPSGSAVNDAVNRARNYADPGYVDDYSYSVPAPSPQARRTRPDLYGIKPQPRIDGRCYWSNCR